MDGKSWIDSIPTVNILLDSNSDSLRATINYTCPEDTVLFNTQLEGMDIPPTIYHS